MKNRIILIFIFICIVVAVTALLLLKQQRNKNPFDKISKENIAEISISNGTSTSELKTNEEIELFWNILKKMNLYKTSSKNKDGFVFILDIKLADGETYKVMVRSKEVVINQTTYKTDKNYCNEFRKVFDKSSAT